MYEVSLPCVVAGHVQLLASSLEGGRGESVKGKDGCAAAAALPAVMCTVVLVLLISSSNLQRNNNLQPQVYS